MKRNGFIAVLLIFATIIFKTTVLNKVSFYGTKPDFVLIMIILFSNYSGSLKGQILGFSTGLVEDFLSLSPLGFNALINAVIGYISGITVGKIFLNPIAISVILVFIGTLLKSFLSFLLLSMFIPEKAGLVYSITFLFEIGMNIIFTPLIYLLFKLFKAVPSSIDTRML